MIIKNKKPFFILITGYQGSGKTTIGKYLKGKIKKEFGKVIYCDGDILRRIFSFYKFDERSRVSLDSPYIKFCKYILKNNISLIFSTTSFSDRIINKMKKEFYSFYHVRVIRSISYRKKHRKKIWKDIKDFKIPPSKKINLIINNSSTKNKLFKLLNLKFKNIIN